MKAASNLVTEEGISKCLEYTEEKERFKELVSSQKVSISLERTGHYFDEDTDVRNIYRVTITRAGKRISFRFGDSINNTLKGETPDLYDILASVGSEYDLNGFSFAEFCDEYGYDEDSRKAHKTYVNWVKHNVKLHRIFNDEDIEVLPH